MIDASGDEWWEGGKAQIVPTQYASSWALFRRVGATP
jgi:hypothetical protein